MLRIAISLAVLAVIAPLRACFSPSSVTCGDEGPTCPSGWLCTADNKHCINPEVTLCGDGAKDEGEQCDDGNLDNHDECNSDCRLPTCGDGFVNGTEVCDDGNVVNGDGCSTDCLSLETCGDSYLNNYTHKDANGDPLAPEECDGGGVNTEACNSDCTNAVCGDGKVNAARGEQCDGGSADLRVAVNTADCDIDCSFALCGDTFTNPVADEQCDNGLYCADGTPCSAPGECAGVLGDGECVTRDFDCCTRTCQNPLCGNGVLEPSCAGFPLEKCDDGRHCADLTPCVGDGQCVGKGDGLCKTRNATGCSANCLSPETCGDGVINNYAPYVELCDDGKHCADLVTVCTSEDDCVGNGDGLCIARSGNGCSDNCKSLEVCGDGILNDYPRVDAQGDPVASEVCDDGRQCEGGAPCTVSTQCSGLGDGLCRTRNSDACSADCLSEERCGDGYLNNYGHTMVNARPTCVPLLATCPAVFEGLTTVDQPFLGSEACDDGNTIDGDGCSSDCLSEERCGDGYLNNYAPYNELCDDGNNSAGDGCAPDCKSTEQCGNSFTDPGEECDRGPANGRSLTPEELAAGVKPCSLSCTFVQCGNARKDPGEFCDEGIIEGEIITSLNGSDARCLESCVCNVCGDGHVNETVGASADCPAPNTRFEECDSNGVNSLTCNFDCTLPECGDGLLNFRAGELCDNGPQAVPVAGQTAESTTCNTDCSQAFCGDGKLNRSRGEVCDDGNNTNGDGCSADCKSNERCGDSIVNPYAVERPDGATAPAEVCDSGWRCEDLTPCELDAECAGIGDALCVTRDGTDCSADCLSKEVCGDRYINADETCDDGNPRADDGCSASCLIETGWACANVLSACKDVCAPGEVGCLLADSATCLTAGEECHEVCGDALVAGAETCDDGTTCADGSACATDEDCLGSTGGDTLCKTRGGDGCDASCEAEAGWSCPVPATSGGAGGACTPVCGDLRVRPGETCDDGNANAGDGCDDHCQIETGWSCEAVLDALGGPCTPDCGDGITRGLETCDDGDTDPLDGCDDHCRSEIGWSCPPAGGSCTAVCGDFVVRGAETCDDGMHCDDGTACGKDADCAGVGDLVCVPRAADGCDATCLREDAWACPTVGFTVTVGGECLPVCGDGLIRGTEACDDGDTASGDGCDSGCQAELGWTCPFAPSANGAGGACTATCNDGLVRGTESCDEGGATPSGGCLACVAQAGWSCPTALAVGGLCTEICGDGSVVGAEECDDATLNDDRADCTAECRDATCADGLLHVLGTGTETDVDCGGATCNPCADTDACLVDSDCQSHYCEPVSRRCEVAPTPTLGDDERLVLETEAGLAIDVALHLLNNDTGHDPATFTAVTTSECGSAITVNGALSRVDYLMPADPETCAVPFQDSFTYTVCSPFDDAICATATVHIVINRRPTLADAFHCVAAGTTRDTLDTAPLYSDADGDLLGTLSATGTGGLGTVAGAAATWAPDDRDLAAIYAVTLDACDDAAVSGCATATWTAVWDDPPTLASFVGTAAFPVLRQQSAAVALTSIITDLGIEGVPAGDEPIASVKVASALAGPFAASATTPLGACLADGATDEIRFTAGATTGADRCFVQVCEVCGTTPVCQVAEVAFDVVAAPVALDDAVTVLEGSPAVGSFATATLVANDTDSDVNRFTLDSAATSCGGAVSLNAGNVAYQAPADPSVCAVPYRDTFAYTVCSPDIATSCDTATVTITINRTPTVADTFSCVAVNAASATLAVTTVFSDPDGAGTLAAASITGAGSGGSAAPSGANLVWTPTNPATPVAYTVTVHACDSSPAPGCDDGAWTAVWNDPPVLGSFTGAGTTTTAVARTTSFAYGTLGTLITGYGALTGVPSGEPIASVTVSASLGGTYAATATTARGACAVNSATSAVDYTAGATAGSDSCFVQICETCGTTPVCAVTELAFTVVPAPTIAPATTSLAVNNTVTFTGSLGIPPYAFSVFQGGGTVHATTGLYTAPASAGAAVVRLTDAQGNTADAAVTITGALAISPTAITLAVNNTTTFTNTGGVGPFVFSVVAGGAGGTIDPATGLYTAPAAVGTGTTTVRVTDALGNTANATVTINAALAISPTTVTLAVNNTTTFTRTGGVGPFTFSVVAGGAGGTINASSGLYTAPAAAGSGTDTVRVTDALGNTSDATVTVNAALAIAPATISLAVNNTTTFTVSGGVGPFTFEVVAGGAGGTINATSGLYTAPAAAGSGTDTVRVTDALGNTSEATVSIGGALGLSPATVTLAVTNTQTFSATGGVGPFTFEVVAGGAGGTIDPTTGLYTAPAAVGSGTDTVQVTDSLSNTATASVTINAALTIAPTTVTLAVTNTTTFTASGGVGPFTFEVVAGGAGGTINATSGLYTAPAAVGSGADTVRVTDALGNTAVATVAVNAALAIAPATISLAVNNTTTFTASGGVGPFTFEVVAGGAGGTINASSGLYTAPAAAGSGTDTVRVTDALGNTSDATVSIGGALGLSPATVTLAVNNTQTFSATGGVGPFTFEVVAGGAGGTIDAATGLYTAPAAVGSGADTVRVTDALANTADATVTIKAALALSPATITLAVNNTTTFTPSGGVGPFTFEVVAGGAGGTINASSGLYTAPAAVGSGADTVRATDSLGNTATATVTLNDALAIAPLTVAVAVDNTTTFTTTGGVGAVTFSVVAGGAGGTIDGASGLYTAPSTVGSGTDTVRATDALGNTADATVTVSGALALSPTTVTLALNATTTFSAAGGVGPYVFSVVAGGAGGTIDPDTGLYTAPAAIGSGSDTVRVTDALANTADATVTVATAPDAPTAATATRGNTQATVTWTAPAFDGGTVITSYTVTSAPDGLTCTGTVPATGCVVSALTNGTAYTFTVTATNAVGTSVASDPSAAVTPATVPDAPTAATATAGSAIANVSWTAPVVDGGSAVTGYTVTASPDGATCTSAAPTTNCDVTGLQNGTAYTFTVTATNDVGDSAASDATLAVTPATVPDAPTAATAVRGNTEATVTWAAPGFDGGSAITGYTVTSNPDAITCTGTDPATGCVVSGLTNGTAYTFTVVATNAVGDSAASDPSLAVTPATVPDAPTAATATAGSEVATVTWTAPVSNGGSAITVYTVTSTPDALTCTGTDPAAGCVVTGLTNGTAYTFTVVATNDVGDSVASSASTAVTPATVPDAPTGATATAGNAQATVTWTAPAIDGGAAITGYTVTASPDGAFCTGTDPAAGCDVLGLINDTAYTFTVVATNSVGDSAPSAASGPVTPVAP